MQELDDTGAGIDLFVRMGKKEPGSCGEVVYQELESWSGCARHETRLHGGRH
jgi:hypothetical protein